MKFLFFSLAALFCFTACNNNMKPKATEMEAKKIPVIIAEPVTYTGDSITMNGFVAYDSALQGKLPVVMIIHEWWGLNDYTKSRAKQLADLGYLAMAVDLYGNGINGNNPEEATKLATPFYTNPLTAQKRFDAALEKIKTFPQADTSKIAAIGYCFGGSIVLNLAALGENLKAVVSFHGGLRTVPAEKNTLKAKILVCQVLLINLFRLKKLQNSGKTWIALGRNILLKLTIALCMLLPTRKLQKWVKNSI